MKILYCYRYGILGGVCTQLWHRFSYLKQDPEIEIHCAFWRDYGVSVLLKPYARLHLDVDGEALERLVAKNDFDLVVVIDTSEYFAALARKSRTFRLMAEIHTSIARNLGYLEDRTWSADRFLVPSDYMKRLIETEFDVGAGEIAVVPNSLDTDVFKPVSRASRYGFPVLLWVGKIDDHKDWRAYLEIAASVNARHPDAEFWIVGGETCRAELAQEVFAAVEGHGLTHRFRWFDRIGHEAMPKVYSAVAASGGMAVTTTHNESFAMSVLEALCCGCPVVSTDVGAIPEIAPDAPFLALYPLGNKDAASERIGTLLEPSAARRVRQDLGAARDSRVERFGLANGGRTYRQTLRDVVHG